MKHRILIVHDTEVETPGGTLMWAYARRSAALQKYAPDDFEVDRCSTSNITWNRLINYDLIFNLCYMSQLGLHKKFRGAAPRAIQVVSYNSDPLRRPDRWPRVYGQADFVVINNLAMFDFTRRSNRTCCIANGIDTDLFTEGPPISEREHVALWRGSGNPAKGKGWSDCLEPAMPLLEREGFICDFQPVDDINPRLVLPLEKLRERYHRASYLLCASRTDATPNMSLEGMACGCVLVTTRVGNALEFGVDGENVQFFDGQIDGLLMAMQRAREQRAHLAAAGTHLLRNAWSYGPPGDRAQYFFQLFRKLIRRERVRPFSYHETPWGEI